MRKLRDIQTAILADHGIVLKPDAAILDIGCGNGDAVMDWLDADYQGFGCDFQFKPGLFVAQLVSENTIRIIESPYRLPFDDDTFDVIVSNQVMEHVNDYPSTIAEMHRVLKPNGTCLHIFPSRLVPIEPHVFVPLATVLRSEVWLSIWAILGVRKSNQRGKSWRSVAEENRAYLTTSTNYLTHKQLHQRFKEKFNRVVDAERSSLRNSPNARGQALYKLGKILPLTFWVYREFWSRTMLIKP